MSNTPVEVPHRHSRRRIIAIAGATAVVVAAGVAIGLWRTVGQSPTERHLTLSALTGTTWDPNVMVSYDVHDLHAATTALRTLIGDVPSVDQVAVVDDIWIQPRDATGAARVPAHVEVVSLGKVPPEVAVAALWATERQVVEPERDTPLADLPAGWQGILMGTEKGRYGDAEVAGVAGTQFVWVSIAGSAGLPSADTATVGHDAAQLVAAIGGKGIPRFITTVARPRGW